MPIATDGNGNYLTLDPGTQKWMPAPRARNDAGDELVLDGGQWKPLTKGGGAGEYGFKAAPPEEPKPPEPEQDPLSGSYLGGKLPPAPSQVVGLQTPPGFERANILPLARNTATGEVVPAIPGMIRDPIVGLTTQGPQVQNNRLMVPGVTFNPETGTPALTPEAASVAPFAASPLRFGGGAMELPASGLLEGRAPLQIEQGNLLSPDAAARSAEHPVGPGVAVRVPGVPPPPPPAVVPSGGALTAPSAGAVPKTAAEAKAIAGRLYDQAAQSGGTLTPQFTSKFIDEVQKIAPQTEEGLAVAGETPITSLVNRIKQLADKPISLAGAQEIDEALGNMIDKEYGLKGLSKEGNNLLDLQSTFRDMIAKAEPSDVSGGAQGFDALTRARAVWAQAMKMGDLERIAARADGQAQPSTGIITGVRTLLANPKRLRGYSPEEIAALQQARDRGTLGEAAYQLGSRLVPMVAGGIGAVGGVPGAIGAYAVTHFGSNYARNLATRMQQNRLQGAMDVLGQGVQNRLGPGAPP